VVHRAGMNTLVAGKDGAETAATVGPVHGSPFEHPSPLASQEERESSLHRHLWCDGDAAHVWAQAVIIVDRIVLGAAIVPHRDGARRRVNPAGEFRPRLVVGEPV